MGEEVVSQVNILVEYCRQREQLEESLKDSRRWSQIDHVGLVGGLGSVALRKWRATTGLWPLSGMSWIMGALLFMLCGEKTAEPQGKVRSVRRNFRNANHLCIFVCRRTVMIPSTVRSPDILVEYWVHSKL